MRNLLNIIVGLLLVIWGIVYFGIESSGAIHLVFVLAVIIGAGGYFYYNAQKREIGN